MALKVREKWERFFGAKDPAVLRVTPSTEDGFNRTMKKAANWESAERTVTGLILTGLVVEALLEINGTLVEIRDELRKERSPKRPEGTGALAKPRPAKQDPPPKEEERPEEEEESREEEEEEKDNDDPADDDRRGNGDSDNHEEEG